VCFIGCMAAEGQACAFESASIRSWHVIVHGVWLGPMGMKRQASMRGMIASGLPPSAPAPGKCSPALHNGPKNAPGSCSGSVFRAALTPKHCKVTLLSEYCNGCTGKEAAGCLQSSYILVHRTIRHSIGLMAPMASQELHQRTGPMQSP